MLNPLFKSIQVAVFQLRIIINSSIRKYLYKYSFISCSAHIIPASSQFQYKNAEPPRLRHTKNVSTFQQVFSLLSCETPITAPSVKALKYAWRIFTLFLLHHFRFRALLFSLVSGLFSFVVDSSQNVRQVELNSFNCFQCLSIFQHKQNRLFICMSNCSCAARILNICSKYLCMLIHVGISFPHPFYEQSACEDIGADSFSFTLVINYANKMKARKRTTLKLIIFKRLCCLNVHKLLIS